MDAPDEYARRMERRFLELVDESGVDRPDRIEHYPSDREIVFYWEEERVAVILELTRQASANSSPS